MKRAVVLTILVLLPLFAFWNIFKFGIYSDDILAIYNSMAYGTGLGIHYLLGPYGGQNFIIAWLYQLFGMHSSYYFITNFFLRIITAITVYLLAKKLTLDNWKAGLFSALLFSVSYAGAGTAEYGLLANIFIALSLFNLGLEQLLEIYFPTKLQFKIWRKYLWVCTLFFLAIVFATVRVNSIIFYIMIFEFLLMSFKKTKPSSAILRILLLVIIYLVLKYLGSFGGDSSYHIEMIKYGLGSIFSSANSAVRSIYYLSATYLDILIPPKIGWFVAFIFWKTRFLDLIKSNVIYVLLALPIGYLDFKLGKRAYFHFVLWIAYLIGFKWAFGDIYNTLVVDQANIGFTGLFYQAINVLVGGLLAFMVLDLAIYLYILKRTEQLIKLLMVFLWPLIFIVITFLFSPKTFAFEELYRFPINLKEAYVHYYYVPALGIYLSIAFILLHVIPSLNHKKAIQRSFIGLVIISILVISNIWSVREWSNIRLAYRSAAVLTTVSATINKEIKTSVDRNRRPLVYITSVDDNSYFYPYAVSEWGFAQYRYGLLNKNYEQIPYFISGTHDELINNIQDPTFISGHNFPNPLTISDIYAFQVLNNHVYSQTQEIRQDLKVKYPDFAESPKIETKIINQEIIRKTESVNPDQRYRYLAKRLFEKINLIYIKIFFPKDVNKFYQTLVQRRFVELKYIFDSGNISYYEQTTSRYLSILGEVTAIAKNDPSLAGKLQQTVDGYPEILSNLLNKSDNMAKTLLLKQALETTNQLFL